MDSWLAEWERILQRHEEELAQLSRETAERYSKTPDEVQRALELRATAREAHRATLLVRAAVMALPAK